MAQQLHTALSFLKSANASSSSLERTTSSHSRSGSFLRGISLHSAHPSSTPNQENQTPTASLTKTKPNNLSSTNLFRYPTNSNDEHSDTISSFNSEDFEIKSPIGYGSSAIVYSAIYRPTNKRVAIKMIDLDLFERNQIDELRHEIALMTLSKHPNVLKVYGSFVTGSKLYVVTPYLSGGSCLDIMKNAFQDGFEEDVIVTILKQTLEGLCYLHKNGHIHRDVKAGNLLMDDHGTVLLADFGVSSSLTENNEVRKTFVGTPCWMAPEVMEQSGYDFKADIWSFGITALELAIGHAPYAKFPPMKVLMMTLNCSPPTLDREHTKNKYSKMFKEMIDSCLHKDPSERPSAEKLLLHPLFKQAERADFLVKSVLACVPPLSQRNHKNIPFNQIVIENPTQQWDFDEVQDKQEKEAVTTTAITPNQKPHISFGDLTIKTEKPNLPSPASSEPEITSPVPVRKSRFVIEESPYVHEKAETTAPSDYSQQYSMTPSSLTRHSQNDHTPATAAMSIFSSNNAPSSTDSVENSWRSSIGLGLGISTTLVSDLQHQQQEGIEIKKGRFSINQHTAPSIIKNGELKDDSTLKLPVQPSSELSHELCNDSMKERKSRFEVQHLPSQSPIFSANSSPPSSVLSHDLHGYLDSHQIKYEPPSSRRERSLSRESINSQKISQLFIEKEEVSTVTIPHVLSLPDQTYSCESTSSTSRSGSSDCRRRGRFELTGGTVDGTEFHQNTLNSHNSPPPSHVTVADSEHSNHEHQQALSYFVHEHMEALVKQTEIQRNMLHDLLFGISTLTGGSLPQHNLNSPLIRARASSVDIKKMAHNNNNISDHYYSNAIVQQQQSHHSSNNPTAEPRQKPQNDIKTTMTHLQQLLAVQQKEKERLKKENKALKCEVERLRKQQLIIIPSTSGNDHIPLPTSILKSHEVPSLDSNKTTIQQPSQSLLLPPVVLTDFDDKSQQQLSAPVWNSSDGSAITNDVSKSKQSDISTEIHQ